ncbi:glycosyl transferase family 1 [Geobacter argillaceus]|uniref:Glycosyl transferase family 1 n=1 Tax=Geobacter argillaceus TaxID=345631 RepID=A0A562VFL9_9BACT|nr:glycosyl transferase family 1 [Geobacter argillaceus]
MDNEFWISQSGSIDRLKIRESIGGGGKIFLAVGQLIARKGFDLFSNAWGRLPEQLKKDNRVVIVGSGEAERVLRGIAVEAGIPNILFVGQQEPCDLASFYAAADVLVFPSLVDVWGMVVNEAMACGVPVLASRYAGASQELIDGTGAGEVIDPLDEEAFSKALERWCSADLSTMRTRAREVIEGCNFNVTVNAIRRLIQDLTDK